eukprot:7140933-Alexandrium_andersonii.AAC.1
MCIRDSSLKDRYRWDGYYYVWVLKDFVTRDLRYDAPYGPYRTLTAHKVKAAVVPDGETEFPPRQEHIRVNETLQGLCESDDGGFLGMGPPPKPDGAFCPGSGGVDPEWAAMD